MKAFLTTILLGISLALPAQKKIDTSIDVSGIKEIKMDFKYPEVIKISAWDKNEVRITGSAVINNGENDENFKLSNEKTGSILNIVSEIENIDNLPKRILIKRDGEEYYFPTDDFDAPEVQDFLKEKTGNYQYKMYGVVKKITLEIKVPRSMVIDIMAKYGLVEVVDISAPITIDAKYGGMDVSLSNTKPWNVTARTKFGEMYSDLDLAVDRSASSGDQYFKWTTIVATLNGGGPACNLTSKYGNVYIRKQ